MKKYAQVKYGKIIYFYHTDLEIGELSSIFSPKTYWIDVTDRECGLGWEVTHDEECNIVLTPPPAPVEPTPPTEEEIQQQLENGVEAYMNSKVAEKHYDSIDTCIGRYLNSPNEQYRKEATAVMEWNTAVWDKCWAILAEVKAGKRAIPTLEEVIAELPTLDW